MTYNLTNTQNKFKYIKNLDKIESISEEEKTELNEVCQNYAFRTNSYYLNLINWEDPDDPIRKIVIPQKDENLSWGKLDASNEAAVTVAKGVQHKYSDTVLLLCNEVCGAYCRYCFRKRLFMDENDEVSLDVSEGIEYIKNNPQVTDVLLTGGDPLLMSTKRLEEIISQLREISHVDVIRIGSKMPAFNPFRILEDHELLNMFKKYSTLNKRIYIMTHFDHPRELTPEVLHCLDFLNKSGVILTNQNPLLKGINDNPVILAELFKKLSSAGITPYYLFQGRPTEGNYPFKVSIVEGYKIFEETKSKISGLSRRIRYVMSHESGKIEIIGVDENHIYLKYHRAKNKENLGKIFVYKRNDDAYWIDDLEKI